MPQLQVNIEGKGGAYARRLAGRATLEANEILLETLDGGMQGGAPSVGIMLLINEEPGIAVLGQTSARLFVMAAEAIKAKYGELVGGVVASADPATGIAHVTVSGETVCTRCSKRIPDSFTFCSYCGHRLRNLHRT